MENAEHVAVVCEAGTVREIFASMFQNERVRKRFSEDWVYKGGGTPGGFSRSFSVRMHCVVE